MLPMIFLAAAKLSIHCAPPLAEYNFIARNQCWITSRPVWVTGSSGGRARTTSKVPEPTGVSTDQLIKRRWKNNEISMGDSDLSLITQGPSKWYRVGEGKSYTPGCTGCIDSPIQLKLLIVHPGRKSWYWSGVNWSMVTIERNLLMGLRTNIDGCEHCGWCQWAVKGTILKGL
jgi:hypothetical protein